MIFLLVPPFYITWFLLTQYVFYSYLILIIVWEKIIVEFFDLMI